MPDTSTSDVLTWRLPETPARRRAALRVTWGLVAVAAVVATASALAGELRFPIVLAVIAAAGLWIDLAAVRRTRRYLLRVTEQRELVVDDGDGPTSSIPTWGARRIHARSRARDGRALLRPRDEWVVLVEAADGRTLEVVLPAFGGREPLDEHEVADLVRSLRWWAGVVTTEPEVASVGAPTPTSAPPAAPPPAGAAPASPPAADRRLGTPFEWRHPKAESAARNARRTWLVAAAAPVALGVVGLVASGSATTALLFAAVIGAFVLAFAAPLAVLLGNVARYAIRVDGAGTCSFLLGDRVRHELALRGVADVRVSEQAQSTSVNAAGSHHQARTSACFVVVALPDGSTTKRVISTAGGFVRVPMADQARLEDELRARAGLTR